MSCDFLNAWLLLTYQQSQPECCVQDDNFIAKKHLPDVQDLLLYSQNNFPLIYYSTQTGLAETLNLFKTTGKEDLDLTYFSASRVEIVQEFLERTNSPTFLILFNSTISVILFNYGKPSTLVTVVTLPTMVKMLQQWAQLRDALLHG
jgi:hypothetical protein